jgi:hypothetical protein
MKTHDKDFERLNEALYKLGVKYCAERNWDKAVETFEKLRRRNPHYENLSRNLWKARIRLSLKRPTSWIVGGIVVIVTVALCLTGVVVFFGPKATPTPTQVAVATTAVSTEQTLPPSITPPTIRPTPPVPEPTVTLTSEPIVTPTEEPTSEPTEEPSEEPTVESTEEPTSEATEEPTEEPTVEPTEEPTILGQIAFPVYDPKRKTYDIYLANVDGSNLRELVEEASEPAISPDGSKIAFRSWNDSTLGLMVSNIDGTKSQRVSRGLEDACACWALEELLVFHSTKEGPAPRLYKAGAWEGANGLNNVQDVRRDTDPVHGQYPAWVPGGRVVYKYFERSGDFRGLYIMNADGSNPVPITDHLGDTMPSVPPRGGDKVAFMSNRTGRWEVYVVNIDGSELRQLTSSGGYNSGLPSWSPDGNYIAFVSDRDNQWAIWVINYNGSGERKLFDLDSPLRWWERISWGP